VAWPAWAAAPFTVNGDGTVTDATTSLVWDQCPYGLTGPACDTGTVFQGDWPTGLTKAVEANAASYKGFTDWRVPNKNELDSIVKRETYTIGQPSIDTSAFPGTPLGWFWTSTTFAPVPLNAWSVLFYGGQPNVVSKSSSIYVRLVRSGQSLASFDLLGSPPDTTLPVTTAGPTLISGTSTTASISVRINEVGTGYWLLVPRAATAPTPAQVMAGANYGTVTVFASGNLPMSGSTPAGINLTGLTPGVQYQLYFVARDTSGNLQAAVSGPLDIPALAVVTATSIPTLSEWGVILLSGLLGLLGLARARRQNG